MQKEKSEFNNKRLRKLSILKIVKHRPKNVHYISILNSIGCSH